MIATRGFKARTMGILTGVVLCAGAATSASAANLFANVNMAGGLISGTGGTTSVALGPGQYEVTFPTNVSGCAFLATTMNAYSQALGVFTAGGHLSPNGVYVETKNQGGGLTPGPFSLVVDCGTPGMMFAVVGYSANLVRSSVGTTLSYLGGGRYEVNFPTTTKTCAYIATVGDPASALVFSPSGVYTGSGSTANAVYIETKNPGGGLQDGVPFHLGVICTKAKKTHIAVVNASGLIDRGAVLTSSYRWSTGEYDVVTNVNINPACATVATRGSVDTAVPFDPATVEIVQGPAGNTIGIEIRSLLFFGGTLANEAFHAATVCP